MDPRALEEAVGFYRDAVEKDENLGVVLLVARKGVIVVHEAIGWSDLDKKKPLTKNSLFKLASNTKPIIATAALILAEEGKLRLDDPIGAYLPAFKNDACRDMRVKHLLNHTSGLRGISIFAGPVTDQSPKHPDAPNLVIEANKFAERGPRERPGETFSYSNAGYNILGAVIEEGSGTPLDTFLRERIYAPLGMTQTVNHESQVDSSRLMGVFRKMRSGEWRERWGPEDPPEYPLVRASGGVISTTWDYAVFLQMYVNGGTYGDVRILSKDSVEMATNPQTLHVQDAQELEEYDNHYGFGWNVYTDSPIYRHRGSDGTFAWVHPDLEIVGLIFSQCIGGEDPSFEFRDRIHSAVVH